MDKRVFWVACIGGLVVSMIVGLSLLEPVVRLTEATDLTIATLVAAAATVAMFGSWLAALAWVERRLP